ncbi:MAG TPA: gamma-glutamyltransferase, partial [Longimicrobiales bacterium]|nr:gamma-glutamyltransferase [Longimicrobiales bacterium]
MVEDLRAGGNQMTVEDMRRYLAQERVPVHTTYRGNDVYAGPPPVTGGAVLAGKLNLLEREPVGGLMTEDAATLHRMIEAWRFQPSTGGRVADPDLWPVDITPFESKDTAALRWRCYSPARASVGGALSREDCGDGGDSGGVDSGGVDRGNAGSTIHSSTIHSSTIHFREDPAAAEMCLAYDRECGGTGTTAYVVADAAGNIVSVTQTLGTWGGNFYVSPGLGFLYNDKLRSYGSNPAGYNARIPYARNTTVISPTIVFRGSGASREPWFGVGAAGNAWITAAVYTMVVGIVDHGLGAQAALELPRFLAGGGGVQIEGGFAPSVLRELESMGHEFNAISLMGELRMGYGAAVVIDGAQVEAGGDPRRGGTGLAAGGAGGAR